MSMWLARFTMATSTFVAMSLPVLAQGAGPGAHMVLSETEHDLGRLDPSDRQRTVEVRIRNRGDRPLEIRKVRTTCVCLTAELSTEKIAPKSESTLKLRITPPALDEPFEEAALIYSNDAAGPVKNILLFGSVGRAIRIVPPGIPIGLSYRSRLDQTPFGTVRLIPPQGAQLGHIRLVPSHPSIRPQIRKLEDNSYELQIALDTSAPVGTFNQSVRVETEYSAAPFIEVPVVGTIEGDVNPRGRRMDFGFIKEGRPASVTFRLPNQGTQEVEILRADAKLRVPADVEVTREDKEFVVVLRIGPTPAFTRLDGSIELHTSYAAEPVVRIEVSGGVLADQPFEQAAADGSDARFMAIVNDVLTRGERIPADRFYSDVLGGVKDERAMAVLLRVLAGGGLAARMRAVQLLGEFRTPEVIARLRDAITDDQESFVRRLAVSAYTTATGKAAVPTLLVALQDDDAWVREDAATYLGTLGDARVIPALRAALNDPDPDAAQAISNALATLQASVMHQ